MPLTYEQLKDLAGAQPQTIVELVLDACSLNYSESPCTAAIGVTGSQECFNTTQTCQDRDNLTLVPFIIRLSLHGQEPVIPPVGKAIADYLSIPCITNVSESPTEISDKGGPGIRGKVKISCVDFPDPDTNGQDKYVKNRTYDPLEQGSFWSKTLARFPFYQGRVLRVYTGYLQPGGRFDWAGFQKRSYVIDSINVDAFEGASIVGKDALNLARDDRAQAPRQSNGRLLADISAGDASLTVIPVGIGSEYPTSGIVRIGGEIIEYSGKSGDILTGLTRGTNGGDAASTHSADAAVQICLEFDNAKVQDVIEDLLVTYASVPSSYIPKADWDIEADTWSDALLNTLITEPVGVQKLLQEIGLETNIQLWWNQIDEEIKLRVLRPIGCEETIPTLTDEFHFSESGFSVSQMPDKRLSQVWYFYGRKNPNKKLDEFENYTGAAVVRNAEAESADEYGKPQIKKILSRWVNSQDQAFANAGRLQARFDNVPIKLTFELEAKDSALWTGDPFRADTWNIQNPDGSNKITLMQVQKVGEGVRGSTYTYEAFTLPFDGLFALWMDDSTSVDYDNATDEQRQCGAFWADAECKVGTGANRTDAYRYV